MKRTCPFGKEVLQLILKEQAPVCFHCGALYLKDTKHCGESYNTWMPGCDCINKPTIRIVTGVDFDFNED